MIFTAWSNCETKGTHATFGALAVHNTECILNIVAGAASHSSTGMLCSGCHPAGPSVNINAYFKCSKHSLENVFMIYSLIL